MKGRVKWSRVKELLEDVMERWISRHGEPAPGIHDYYWDTPQALANKQAIRQAAYRAGKAGE